MGPSVSMRQLAEIGRSITIMSGLLAGTASMLPAAPFETPDTVPSILTDQPTVDADLTAPTSVGDSPASAMPTAGLATCLTPGGYGYPAALAGQHGAYAAQGTNPGCGPRCGEGGHGSQGGAYGIDCDDPPGLLQFFKACHEKGNACWIGRTDALVLWRSTPPDRPLVETGLGGEPVLNADGMDSPAAGGVRFSLLRFNRCNGTGIEATYLQAANWRSERPLSAQSQFYALTPPGIYGNDNTFNFDTGYANLGASVRSFEVNRHWSKGEHLRFLAGFRWLEWQESFSLSNEFDATPTITDYYETDCVNDLYGGQIGLDMWLLSLPWMRIDSVVKAGAFYNNAVQSSVYRSNVLGPTESQKVQVGQSPLNCAFIGELGVTGVIPVCSWLDFRVGYFGLWLSGIAQPTQQLSGQVLTQPAGGTEPTSGSINADGGVLVQGATLGLEARW